MNLVTTISLNKTEKFSLSYAQSTQKINAPDFLQYELPDRLRKTRKKNQHHRFQQITTSTLRCIVTSLELCAIKTNRAN